MKKKIFIVVVIFWMIIIFLFSNSSSYYSNDLSKGIIHKIIDLVELVSFIDITSEQREIVVDVVNPVVRKVAHMLEYFILSLLIFNILKFFRVGKKKYALTIGICFIYSILDEYHQTFIDGRTGQFIDCIIDMVGCILFLILVIYQTKKYKNSNKSRTD